MTYERARTSHNFSSNFEHGVHALPAEAVLLEVIKTFETRLHDRRMLASPRHGMFPLWFLVETERNTFLWRKGLSLADAGQFQFWINPLALIEKRLTQLELSSPDNPFTNFSWGTTDLTFEGAGEAEEAYLHRFAELFGRSAAHLHALSVASAEMLAEAHGPLPKVLLPVVRQTRQASS